jgi:hypothetical protein
MLTYNQLEFENVLQYCKQWGVCVYEECAPVSYPENHKGEWHYSPIWGTIHWLTKTIYWNPEPKKDELIMLQDSSNSIDFPSCLLHELSHCLHYLPPDKALEAESEMLAFEYYSSLFLGLSGWGRWMSTFWLPGEGTWETASESIKSDLLKSSLVQCIQKKLLNDKRQPTYNKK